MDIISIKIAIVTIFDSEAILRRNDNIHESGVSRSHHYAVFSAIQSAWLPLLRKLLSASYQLLDCDNY